MQALFGEGLVLVLGLPYVDIPQPGVGSPGQVGDQSVRALTTLADGGKLADAYIAELARRASLMPVESVAQAARVAAKSARSALSGARPSIAACRLASA